MNLKLKAIVYTFGASLAGFISQAMLQTGRIRPRRRWHVYYLREDEPTDFTVRQFKSVIAPECYTILAETEGIRSFPRGEPLFYIGHGDQNGVYSCGGFSSGITHYLCSKEGVSSPEWTSRPSVWWACHSARWLTESQRTDWLGFGDIIGYDLSTSAEKRWWELTLRKIIRAVVLVGEGAESPKRLQDLVSGLASEAVFSQHTSGEKRTYMTQLFVVALEDAIHHGQAYGGSNELPSPT